MSCVWLTKILRKDPPRRVFSFNLVVPASRNVILPFAVVGTVEGGGTHKDFRFGARTRPPQWL